MDIKERATRVKILLLDVDGVLTDGKLYYTSQGEEIKVFNVKDGLGIKLAQRANIRIGVISGRKSLALINRLEELGIEEIHLGLNNKLPILEEILGRLSLKYENVAFLGDDYVDLPVLRRVGFPMVVADSPEELKRHALYVREVTEFLLKQRGQCLEFYF